jgi:DNA-damage-inducible protein D
LLGEATTTQITQQKDSKDIDALRHDAQQGGAIAGRTRKDIEQHTGKSVISEQNFLPANAKKIKNGQRLPHNEKQDRDI